MDESMVMGAPWYWKWSSSLVSRYAHVGSHASSGTPRMWTRVRWNPRLAQRREERRADSPIFSGMWMMSLGVGQENGRILGVRSGVGVYLGVVYGGGGGTMGVCTR